MKSVLIIYDQAHHESVMSALNKLSCRGYTYFEQVQGRGTKIGEPHQGSHAWPGMCSAIISVVEDERVDSLLEALKKIDEEKKQLGLRAFVWNIEKSI